MILIGGLLSTMSALNATIYSSSRVSFAMGRDRNLPAWFGKVHPMRKTPHWAILASAALIAFMAVSLPIEAVASAADIMFLLLFIQVLVVVIALRKKRPELRRGFKVPWVPVVPIVGIVLQLFLAAHLFFYSPKAWLSAAAWIGVGLAVFYGYARRRDRAYAQLVAKREAAERRDYRILVCVGNLRHARSILQAAVPVARHYNGELVVLNVVEVEERELLARGFDSVDKAGEMLEKAVASLRADGVPVKQVVKISHRISYGIIETASEENCNLIVMGRPRRTGLLQRLAATVVDRVVRSAPAQVMVISAEQWPEEIRRVLLAYESGPHADLTTDLAGAFAQAHQGRVRAVHVLPRLAPREQIEWARLQLDGALGSRDPAVEYEVVQSVDILTGLLEQAQEADLILIGGTEAGVVEQLLGYALPLELADRTSRAVVTVYEMAEEPEPWLM